MTANKRTDFYKEQSSNRTVLKSMVQAMFLLLKHRFMGTFPMHFLMARRLSMQNDWKQHLLEGIPIHLLIRGIVCFNIFL